MAAATATATAAASLLLSLSLPGAAARPPPPPAAVLRFCYSASAAKQHRQLAVVFLAGAPSSGAAHSCRRRRYSAAAAVSSAGGSSEKWVLEPAGDGDWRHIGYRVARPGAIAIPASGAVTVGRVAEKADAVLPVATVSGVHARLEAKDDGTLAVTDMDSTNGTYVNERKLVPGFAVAVSPGSLLIFGDVHLAMFRVTKVVVDAPPVTAAGAGDEEEEEAKIEVVSVAEETSS